jgi:hypothetical protein
MTTEQASAAVYGVFFDEDYEGQVLMGLYSLEEEAEAAREAYIAAEMKLCLSESYSQEFGFDYLREHVVVRRMDLGQPARYDFTV